MRVLAVASALRLILLICLVCPLLSAPARGSQRRIALTFDDLPAQRAQFLSDERIRMITDSLIAALARYAVPAIGFVNEDKLYRDGSLDPDRLAALERWLTAGLELGNHSFSHPDLHQVSVELFETDVSRGDDVTRPLAEQHAIPYRFFRHPYLHTGRDLETKQAVEGFLKSEGYRVAPVTIDNSEWIFARAFAAALDQADPALQQRLGDAYVRYMMQMVAYFEDQSRALFDRDIPQVLLLHANDLNAHYLDRLLAALDRRGYQFVSLPVALEDPAFTSPDTFTGAGGISWLHRWALTRGVDSDALRGEPTLEPWVEEVAGIEE